MKILGRKLSDYSPVLLGFRNEFCIWGGDPIFFKLMFRISRMNGSYRTTSYYFQIETKTKRYEISYVWRPGVALDSWRKP